MRVNSATAYELMRMDATDQASVVRNGEVSAEELVEASILQIEKLNPALNAVIHPMFEKAQDQIATVHPGAPFAGVPFLVKDILCHTAGDPYHLGMQFLRRLRFDKVRETLLHARPTDSVSSISGQWGFTHLGRFAVDGSGLQVAQSRRPTNA